MTACDSSPVRQTHAADPAGRGVSLSTSDRRDVSGTNGAACGTNDRVGFLPLLVVAALWVSMCSIKAIVATQQATRAGEAMGVGQAWSAELTSFLALLLALPVVVTAHRWATTRRIAVPRLAVFGSGIVLFSLVHLWGMMTLRAVLSVQLMEAYLLEDASDWLFQAAADVLAFLIAWVVLETARALRVQPDPIATTFPRKKREAAPAAAEPPVVQFPDGSRSFEAPIGELTAVRGGGNYVELIFDRLPAKLVRTTMGEAQAILQNHGFQRIHKSWLVTPAAIEALDRTPAGDYSVRLRGGVSAPLSRRNKLLLTEVRRSLSARCWR